MHIFIHKNGAHQGPFTPEQVKELVGKREVSMSDLAWHEGCSEWFRIHEKPELVALILPAPPEMPTVAQIPFPALPSSRIPEPATQSPPSPQPLTSIESQPAEGVYAGLEWRFLAGLIDTAIMILPALVGNWVVVTVFGPPFDTVFIILAWWLYHAMLESSNQQATVGARYLNMKVTDENGARLSFGRATGRYFASILSSILCYAGFLTIPFSRTKQGLHDMIAKTLVIKQPKRM
jgi:uncharacterized RDD family membrane protein YckC